MKGIKTGLLACAVALVSQFAHAQPCSPCCDWGDVSLGAKALLWKVGACDTMYSKSMINIFLPDPPPFGNQILATTKENYVPLGWDWGVQVVAALDRGCFWGEVDYLWYETSGSASTTPLPLPEIPDANLQSELAILGADFSWTRVNATARVRYQHATVAVGLPFCCTPCCRLDGLALARYLDLDMRMRVDGIEPFSRVVRFPGHQGIGGADLGFKGGGIGIGIRGSCNVACGFEVNGGVNFFGFFGNSQTAHSRFRYDPPLNEPPEAVPPVPPDEVFPGTDLAYEVPGRTSWVPGIDARLAVSYVIDCGCAAVTVELGWDTHHYFHALHETTAESENSGAFNIFQGAPLTSSQLKTSQFDSISFGGPTFGVRADF